MAVKQKNKSTGLAARIMRRNAIHLIAFGFVAGRMKCQGVPFTQATDEFLQHFGLTEQNQESLEREIRRMVVEYMSEGL